MSVSVSEYVPNAEEIISFSNHCTYFDEDKVVTIVFDGLLNLYEQVIPSPKSVLLGEKDMIEHLNNPSMVPISGYSSNPFLSYRESGVLPNTHMPTRSSYNKNSYTLTSQYMHNKLSVHIFKQGEHHLYVNFRITPTHSPDKESEREANRIEYRVADVIYQQINDHFSEKQVKILQ